MQVEIPALREEIKVLIQEQMRKASLCIPLAGISSKSHWNALLQFANLPRRALIPDESRQETIAYCREHNFHVITRVMSRLLQFTVAREGLNPYSDHGYLDCADFAFSLQKDVYNFIATYSNTRPCGDGAEARVT